MLSFLECFFFPMFFSSFLSLWYNNRVKNYFSLKSKMKEEKILLIKKEDFVSENIYEPYHDAIF